MAWKLKEITQRPVKKSLAEWLSGLPQVCGERPLASTRLAFLSNQINAGKAIVFRWAVAILPDGRKFRINGQHSSHLFSNGLAIPEGAMVSLEWYDCETERDMADLWARFDPTTSNRSKLDILRAYLRARGSLLSLSQRPASLVVSAISMDVYGPGITNKMSQADKCDCLELDPDFTAWACDLIGTESGTILRRVGVVWAMFRTWQKSKTDARTFWDDVASGRDEDPNSATRQLQKLLLTAHANTGAGARGFGRKFDIMAFLHICIQGWNVWRRNPCGTWKPMVYKKARGIPDAI